jgi:hypothetical protein
MTMRIRLIGLGLGALSSLACLAPACSSSQPDPYATVSEYCAAYAKAICQIGNTSCQFAPSGCETYQSSQCSTAAAQATASGALTYTPGNVQACITQLNNAYGNSPGNLPIATLNQINQICGQVFVGSVTTGGSCQVSSDCAVSGEICATAPGQTAKCEQPTPKTAGAQCLDIGDQCPTGDYCDSTMGSSTYATCTPAQTTGQPCSLTQPCDDNNSCIGGACALLAGEGATCSTNSDCASGLFCDTYTDTEPATSVPACVNEYTFARGSVDCIGLEGQGTNGMAPGPEAGTSEGGGAEGGGEGGTDGGSGG